MAKKYSGLEEEHVNVNGRALLLKVVKYPNEKENALYVAVFVITGYLVLVCQWMVWFGLVGFMAYQPL